MSFESLSERLTALQESNVQLKDLIDRLATINFQPGSIPLDSEDGNVATELTAEIHQTIKDQDEDFEMLQEEVYDIDSGRPGSELQDQKNRLDQGVKRGIKELKIYQTAFRRAQLSARRNLEAAQRAERELLLQSYLEPRSSNASPLPGQRRQPQKITSLSKEEKEVNASSDVTLALRRTHDMMASELSRSHFAHDTLKESTTALAQLSETYSTLDTMLARSKNLLGTLLTSQKSDTWYLETAFYILLSTIAWLVFRRLIYGPTWLLLWLPLKLLKLSYTLLIGISTATGLIGGSNVSVRTSSMAARETVVNDSAMRGAAQATMSGVGASSVNVGGGGGGGTSQGSASEGSGESVSEQVGRIIDESREEQAVPGEDATEEEQAQDQLNPKKRMWEEDKKEAKEAQRKKDEL